MSKCVYCKTSLRKVVSDNDNGLSQTVTTHDERKCGILTLSKLKQHICHLEFGYERQVRNDLLWSVEQLLEVFNTINPHFEEDFLNTICIIRDTVLEVGKKFKRWTDEVKQGPGNGEF